MEVLKHQPQVLMTPAPQGVVAQGADIGAIPKNFSVVGLRDARQAMKQGGLAGA